MVPRRQLVLTILAGLVIVVGASPSPAREIGAVQVNIESKFLVASNDRLRDLGVKWTHLLEQSTFNDFGDYIEFVVFGEFGADFRKRYKATSAVRAWCNNGQNIQSGRKNFKSQKGENKHRFRKRMMMIPKRDCPFPIQIQIEVRILVH